ncbi:uroporphyrinogen-III C-methyltransferase [Microbulbifer pacificus]|uniref:Uroporphyrinogen-III C-methyltransferase n=1 Tax=Microbulbifer pacificus TaxID=407164 RepID=A0AAU0N2Y3_9GAMM|nr:uroporphyrinogen-III C-methyltransferase [Microbulbifer pacificus]WOX07166.1 uroporphyrinogen-III C-methyltransferase [Microbulbifer pacificus]
MSDKKVPPSSGTENSARSNNPDIKADNQQHIPLVTEKAEPKSNFAKADTGKTAGKVSAPRTVKKRSAWRWFWLLLLLLVAAAVAAWYLVPGVRQQLSEQLQSLPVIGQHFATDSSGTRSSDAQNTSEADSSQSAPEAPQVPSDETNAQAPTSVAPVPEQPVLQPDESRPPEPSSTSPVPPQDHSAQMIVQLREQLAQQSQTIQQLEQQLAGLQRNVTAQGNRLSQLGNASREDWQLAEADYLLRLANQRLMLEQDSRAALGLLQEVDTIVRDVDLPDLYGVRQQLARDITALKLAENVDREGLYLRLRALEEQMVNLNIQPQFDLAKRDVAAAQHQADNRDVGEDHFRSSWDNFVDFLKGSVRIRDGEVDPVLLSPQSETRFRQSLRLNMEQAELAVLRADDTVYKDSLAHARQLLLDYGVDNPQRQVILSELEDLGQQKITTDLPNLSASQSALRNYIDRMHKVSSGQSPDSDNGGEQP